MTSECVMAEPLLLTHITIPVGISLSLNPLDSFAYMHKE